MRYAGPALASMAVLLAAPVGAQQSGASSPVFTAERDAAIVSIREAGKLSDAGQEGPGSEACRFTTDAIEHFTKAGVAVGAIAPGVNPDMLTNEQRKTLNEKIGASFERNAALKRKACRTV